MDVRIVELWFLHQVNSFINDFQHLHRFAEGTRMEKYEIFSHFLRLKIYLLRLKFVNKIPTFRDHS